MDYPYWVAIILIIVMIFYLMILKHKKEKDTFVTQYMMKNSKVPIVVYDNKFMEPIPEGAIEIPNSMTRTRDLQVYMQDIAKDKDDHVGVYLLKQNALMKDGVVPTNLDGRLKTV